MQGLPLLFTAYYWAIPGILPTRLKRIDLKIGLGPGDVKHQIKQKILLMAMTSIPFVAFRFLFHLTVFSIIV